MSGYYNISLSFTCCPAYGTYYTSYCSGYNLYYTYHDGSCGYYDVFQGSRQPTCGHTGCTSYSYTWYGFETWYDCDGNANYEYMIAGDSRCIDNNYGAGGYWSNNFFSCA